METNWPLTPWFPLLMVIVTIVFGVIWHRILSKTKIYEAKVKGKGCLMTSVYLQVIVLLTYVIVSIFFVLSAILDTTLNLN